MLYVNKVSVAIDGASQKDYNNRCNRMHASKIKIQNIS
jgi:hypothetical protein